MGDLDGEDCTTLGLDGGTLACELDCTFDLSGCTGCGNGTQEGGESCDGDDLAGQTCVLQLGPAFTSGALSCDGACAFDSSLCCVPDGGDCVDNGDCCNGTCDVGGTDVCV